jgi:hypothetical protein
MIKGKGGDDDDDDDLLYAASLFIRAYRTTEDRPLIFRICRGNRTVATAAAG